jgi:transcriptional regulator with XRE-family HTH domain
MGYTKSESDYFKRIGRNIKEIREKRGFTQKELADLCDIEKPSMNRLEAGRTNVTAKTILKVAKALHADPSELMRNKG